LYLGSFKIEETDAKWSLSEVWLEAGELSREENSEDAKGSISITQIGGCPTAPAGYTVVNESKNNTQGFETCSRTFYKDDSELSRSNDYVGSQLAESIEVFSPTVAPTPTNGTAVLGNKSTSNVDGIPTTRYTFLVPSVLSESSDKVGSQLAITVEAFNETPATPTGYVIASEQASDVEGIPTTRYTFLKPGVLSQSNDKVGSQLAIVIEAFNETPATPFGYSLANTQVSDVEGIVTNRHTFLKPSILSQSEDKVGSQLAITIEAFEETPATPAGYVIANTRVSDVEGIPTTRYTFLKPSILSKSSDKIGSQLAITIEAFGEIPATPAGYVIANEQVSDFEGIATNRYTFLKPSILSQTEDKVGSQLAIVIEAFNETPNTPSGYSLASTQVSDVEGIATNRYTFLLPSILRVQAEFVGGQQTVSASAFSLDETEVAAAVAEVTGNHLLISSSIDDVDGIPTSRFTYEVDSFEVNTTSERGLLVTSLVELSIADIASEAVGVAERAGLFLTSEQIDNGGTIKRRATQWSEAGILSRSSNNLSEGVQEVTTTFLVAEIANEVVGPVVKRSTQNVDGLQTISVSTLQDGAGNSIVGAGTNTVAEYQQLYPFTYPGVLSIKETDLFGTGRGYNFTSRDFSLEPPSQCQITATTMIRFSTKNLVDSSYKIWSPKTWAKGYARGIGWGYSPFSIDKGFRGYRVAEDSVIEGVEDGAVDKEWSMVLGNRVYNGTSWEIGISGGPLDPAGSTYTLDYKITQAFQDVDGVPYYRHVMTYATIPQQT